MAAGLIRRISFAATPKPRPSVSTAPARFSGERPDGVADAMVTTSEAGNSDAIASTPAEVCTDFRALAARRGDPGEDPDGHLTDWRHPRAKAGAM